MTVKFVRIEEIVKRGQADVFDGILIEKTTENVTAVVCGPNNDDRIMEKTFDLDSHRVTTADKETIEHFFRLSILKSENKLNDAHFGLLEAQRELNFSRKMFAKHVGKLIQAQVTP